jgi:transposase
MIVWRSGLSVPRPWDGAWVMSVQPMPWPEPAPEVVAAVRVAYRRREPPLAVAVRDRFGELFPDAEFAVGFGVRGRPGWSPGRLALVTVLQMAENLTDRQAADAVRDKISWKYALGLALADEGFDASVLSEFRARVVAHGLEQRVLDLLLDRLKAEGLVGAGGRQRTDSTHVIAAVRELNRTELAGESVRACVEALAAAAPDWLSALIDAGVIEVADWGRRYGARVDSWRLPSSAAKRAELMTTYGSDAMVLLRAVYASESDLATPAWLAELPAVEVLRVMLVQNYVISTDTSGREVIRARKTDIDGLPPCRARLISPYDPDARFAVKGKLRWSGYKVHVTETCDTPEPDQDDSDQDDSDQDEPGGKRPNMRPNLIVGVVTTDATVPDARMTETIHAALARRGLLPAQHLVDSGYPSAALLVDARHRWGIELISPLQADKSHQAKAGAGYDRSRFTIDFDAQQAICPQGQTSSWWDPVTLSGTDKIVIKFAARTCRGCPVREQCTRSRRGGRQLTAPTREVYHAQLSARASHNTPEGQDRYAARAGVEGTIGQAVAVTGIRRARYRGLAKTELEHAFSATALNLIRLHAYWNGHALERSRTSHLTRLELALAA